MGQPATTDRLDVWQDIIRENFVALDIEADRRASFRGLGPGHAARSPARRVGDVGAAELSRAPAPWRGRTARRTCRSGC